MNLEEIIPLKNSKMNLEEAIQIITKRVHKIENNVATFVNKYATFLYDGITQHADFYFKDPKHSKAYDRLIKKRNKMRTAINVLRDLMINDCND